MIPAAIAIARRLPWRYIGAALGALAIVLAIYNAGKRSERARLMPQLERVLANNAALAEALAKQNAAIAEQGKAADVVAKASDKAVRTGAERRGALDAAAARVEAVRPSVACGAVPGDVRALWGEV